MAPSGGVEVQLEVVAFGQARQVLHRTAADIRHIIHQTDDSHSLKDQPVRNRHEGAWVLVFRDLQVRSALGNRQDISGQLLGLAVDREFEPVRQQRLQHGSNVVARSVGVGGLGDDVEHVRVGPLRSALYKHALDAVCQSDDLPELCGVQAGFPVADVEGNSVGRRRFRQELDRGYFKLRTGILGGEGREADGCHEDDLAHGDLVYRSRERGLLPQVRIVAG